MSSYNAKAKPYKLKASDGDNITQDDVSTWSYTMQACIRQVKELVQFLPTYSKQNWKAKSEDPNYGLVGTKQ